MKPPQEWLEDYDVWLASQPKEIQDELKDVPASEIVWQVDGNLYGRQSAAVQYRDRLEEYWKKNYRKKVFLYEGKAGRMCLQMSTDRNSIDSSRGWFRCMWTRTCVSWFVDKPITVKGMQTENGRLGIPR